ncbi:PREDICTED: putative nuclease HARBI1, partial [Trachymyrmex cornetzi]|uniref:putative nuclease HARBI1 n=1 Tax=Trachymyrmex cornetzi TaxID=471704 RepID=UPI00084F4DD7
MAELTRELLTPTLAVVTPKSNRSNQQRRACIRHTSYHASTKPAYQRTRVTASLSYNTIWILSKQESYLSVGDRFGLSKSTGHGIVKEIVNVLVQLIPEYIVWPNRQMCNISSTIFERRSGGFPGVVGAIDGVHIKCKAPPGNANDYYNRKGFHSIILQGVCDHTGRFINIYTGLPGRMHDARVFRYSNPYGQLTNAEDPLLPSQLHLIGDAAYPLLHNLMTPNKDTGHLTRKQIIYNTKLSCIRSIIERTYGFLKTIF